MPFFADSMQQDMQCFAQQLLPQMRGKPGYTAKARVVQALERLVGNAGIEDVRELASAFAAASDNLPSEVKSWQLRCRIYQAHMYDHQAALALAQDAITMATAPDVIARSLEEAVVFQQIGNRNTEEGKKVVERYKELLGKSLLLVPMPNLATARAALRSEFPYAGAVIDRILSDVAVQPYVQLRPTILIGSPESGKSRFAHKGFDINWHAARRHFLRRSVGWHVCRDASTLEHRGAVAACCANQPVQECKARYCSGRDRESQELPVQWKRP
ncbi:hypothetical protein AB4097_08750 [Microvirga sp. 2MCAF35]|uniref:hypothetical protein n=1 Tax=Microvirga sp. 2MCAF35 TaxID=3232987 RepID=UPI003F96C294